MEVNWWKAEEDEIIKREWIVGSTVLQIAMLLGQRRSKNSIIGRAHRLGLGKHPVAQKKRDPQPKVKCVKGDKGISATKTANVGTVGGEDFTDWPEEPPKDNGCKWPVGMNPRVADFYCGAERRDDKCSYCKRHAAIAYAAAEPPSGAGFAIRKSAFSFRG